MTLPRPTRADLFTGISRIRVCLYHVPRVEFGGDEPAGTFITDGVLSGGPRLDLGSLFTGPPEGITCTQEATRFAVITRTKVGQLQTAYLELDGCHRLLVQTWVKPGSYDKQVSTLSQAYPALVSAVDRSGPSP